MHADNGGTGRNPGKTAVGQARRLANKTMSLLTLDQFVGFTSRNIGTVPMFPHVSTHISINLVGQAETSEKSPWFSLPAMS